MKKIAFMAKCRGGQKSVIGIEMASGLVLHRTIGGHGWTVSDPVCGSSVANGRSIPEAVVELRTIQARFGDAFSRVLLVCRTASNADDSASFSAHWPPRYPHWSSQVTDWPACYWAPMKAAPMGGCLIVRGKSKDGDVIEGMHWASDLSGEDQPAFQGWFVPCASGDGFVQVQPVAWQPIEVRP